MLLPYQVYHYSGEVLARGLENTVPFWHCLSLCWDFSLLWGNETKPNSEPWSLLSTINRDVGVVILLAFSLHSPVVAGRDELILLLLSCPDDPARQETGSLLPASLPAPECEEERCPLGLGSCAAMSLCEIVPASAVSNCALQV